MRMMYYDRRVFQLCGPSHISPNNNSVLNNKFKKWKCERCYYTFELLVASRNNLWVYLIIARAYHIFILTFFPRIRIFKKIRIRFRQHIVLYNNHPAPYRLSRVRIFQFKNFPLSRIEPRNLLGRKGELRFVLCIYSRGYKFAHRIFEILSGERKVLVKLAFLKRTPFQTDEGINRGSLWRD